METILLIRYAEIHLKGLNRPFFERMLERKICAACKDAGCEITLRRESGRMFAEGFDHKRSDDLANRIAKVFGVHSVSPALAVDKQYDAIKSAAAILLSQALKEASTPTFKVFARRSDKRFHMNSDTICRELGHDMLVEFPSLSVNVHNPCLKLSVEIRERALIYMSEIKGVGGMPVGSAGRATLLLSGGIDSPVAGYMMAKRGLELSAVYFHSHPYTSERAKRKVIDLAEILSEYTGRIRLHIVPFTEIQLAIHEKCPEKETTLLMRRLMMRIAEIISKQDSSLALITGESLGQVASQTLESLCVTDNATSMPVFRPLIGLDKIEIMDMANKIGTYDTSILPYEDCCTIFVPKHPTTKPSLNKLLDSEAMCNFEPMIEKALADKELHITGQNKQRQ